jgi:hypothetical protein
LGFKNIFGFSLYIFLFLLQKKGQTQFVQWTLWATAAAIYGTNPNANANNDCPNWISSK